jgi:hypothetical protein
LLLLLAPSAGAVHVYPKSKFLEPRYQVAAGRTEVGTCELSAREKASSDEYHRQLEQKREEVRQFQAKSQKRLMIYFPGSILATLLLSFAASFLTRRTKPESKSLIVSLFVGATLVALALAVWAFFGLLGAFGSYGLLVLWLGPFGGLLLLIGILGMGVSFASNSAHVTRFRVFVLTLGISAPILLWVCIELL